MRWVGNRWDWVQCGRGACKEFNEFIKRHYDPKLSDLKLYFDFLVAKYLSMKSKTG